MCVISQLVRAKKHMCACVRVRVWAVFSRSRRARPRSAKQYSLSSRLSFILCLDPDDSRPIAFVTDSCSYWKLASRRPVEGGERERGRGMPRNYIHIHTELYRSTLVLISTTGVVPECLPHLTCWKVGGRYPRLNGRAWLFSPQSI